jgi:hypothetical protein
VTALTLIIVAALMYLVVLAVGVVIGRTDRHPSS